MTLADRLLRVVPAALVVALPAWFLAQNDGDECRDLGQCLGLTLDQVAYLVFAAWPLLWLALRGLGVQRAFLTAVVGAGLAWFTWNTTHSVQDALDPKGYGDPSSTISLVAAVAAVAVSAAVATVVVGGAGGGTGSVVARVALPLVLLALNPATTAWEWSAAQQRQIDDVAAVGVTTYQPRIGGEVAGGHRDGDAVRIHYSLGDVHAYQSVDVTLSPADPGTDLCALVTEELLTATCTTDGTTMRAVRDKWTEVAVVRGDTVLHADTFGPTLVGADELIDALRTAPRVTPRELVTTDY